MTREEYIKIKKDLDESVIDFHIVDEVLDIMKKYIKEQEPKTDILEQIRDHFEAIALFNGTVKADYVLRMLDKAIKEQNE